MQNMNLLLTHIPKLKQGDILLSNYTHQALPGCPSITKGKYYLIRGIEESLFNTKSSPQPKVYDMVLCSKNGKPYKTDFRINCYGIDQLVDKSQFTVLTPRLKYTVVKHDHECDCPKCNNFQP